MKPWVNANKSRLSSVGAALTHASKCPKGINILRRKTTNRNDTNQMRAVSAAPTGLNKYIPMINPGLAPWAMQEYRPLGAHCPTAPINPPKQTPIPQIIQSKSNKYTNERNNSFTHPNTFNEHNTTTQHRKRPIRQ